MPADLYLKTAAQGKAQKDILPEDYALYLYKEPGWHNLGTVSETPKNRREIMEITEMNFEAVKMDLFAGAGLLPVADKFAIINPNRAISLGVVGSDYKIVQWSEIFDFVESMREFLPDGLTYESAGLLNNGERGFVQIRLGDSFKFGKDEIAPYLFVFNSMDGSKAVTISASTTRIVCSNTLAMAMEDGKKFKEARYSLRHSLNVGNRMQEAKKAIIRTSAVWEIMQEDIKRMSDTKAPEGMIETLIAKMYGEIEEGSPQKAVSRRENITADVYALYNGETCKGTSGDSVWAALQAGTEYAQYHSTSHGEGTAKAFARLESDLLGKIHGDKMVAYEYALSLV